MIAPIAEGKVREIYSAGPEHLVLVTSDRISAYDEILPTEIPDKGRLLNALSVHWFAETEQIVPNHLVGWRCWRKR